MDLVEPLTRLAVYFALLAPLDGESAEGQTLPIHLMIDRADLNPFQSFDPLESFRGLSDALIQAVGQGFRVRKVLLIEMERPDEPDERPPFQPLEQIEVRRRLRRDNLVVVHPLEVFVVKFKIPGAIKGPAGEAGRDVVLGAGGGTAVTGRARRELVELGARGLPRDFRSVLEGHDVDGLRVKGGQPVRDDEDQKTDHHHHAQGQCTAEPPKERLPAGTQIRLDPPRHTALLDHGLRGVHFDPHAVQSQLFVHLHRFRVLPSVRLEALRPLAETLTDNFCQGVDGKRHPE